MLMMEMECLYLVGGLGPEADKVPHGVGVLAVGDGVPLLGVDEGREEDGVADEKDGRVVAHNVPVAVLGVELDGKATRVPVASMHQEEEEEEEENRSVQPPNFSSVHIHSYSFYLAVSAEPDSPPTVLNLAATLVFFPTVWKGAALVRCAMECVHTNSPKAPAPLACTT
jgi:hypothetical protein